MRIENQGRAIILPDTQEAYRPEVESYFESYFGAVDEEVTELDFTEPRLTKLHGLDIPVWLPSFTEPIAHLQRYIDFALLGPGDTAIDAGGYAGLTAMLLALQVGSKGSIITLEPDPVSAECARRNIFQFARRYGYGPTLIEAALWSSPGTLTFTNEGAMGSGATEFLRGRNETITVQAITLSDIAEQMRRVDYLKLDIEGAEGYALTDAGFFDAHHPRITVECHLDNGPQITELLQGHGYEVREVRQESSQYPLLEAH